MFERLFSEGGLSLDRLRAMLEVAATGSIAKAARGDPVRQSQYSRQIRELEDFFRIKLIERHGRGMQLTPNGKELARISRFFLLGLSNFQRGCLAEDQTFRIGASATIIEKFILPIIVEFTGESAHRYNLETVKDDEIERRLHDLTLDFGVVTKAALSRPLQMKEIGRSRLSIYVPKRLYRTRARAAKALLNRALPLITTQRELDFETSAALADSESRLACDSFLAATEALERQTLAAVLPDFLETDMLTNLFWKLPFPSHGSHITRYRFAWNPRLLRLNPSVVQRRDLLIESISSRFGR